MRDATINKSPYYDIIREQIAKQGAIGTDPRHVEAYMRLGHSTLDGLSASQFRNEVEGCIGCVHADGIENAERCAQSFGL